MTTPVPDNLTVSARRSAVAAGAAIGVALMVAALTFIGVSPFVSVLVLPAVAAAAYLVPRPHLTLVAMVVCEVANISGVVGSHGPFSMFRISLLLGMISLGLALRDPVARSRLNRWTVVFIGLVGIFLMSRLLASIGAQDVVYSLSLLTNEGVDFFFIIVVLMLIQVTERQWAVAAAVVVPLAVLGVLTLINQVVFGGGASFGGLATVTEATGEMVTTARYGGPLPDSNFWGRHLIMGLPLAGALIARARRTGRAWVATGWAAAMLGLLIGIYLTQSRGTFIATLVVLTVWTVASGPGARRSAVTMTPVVLLILLVPGVGNRLIALLGDLWGPQWDYSIDPSVAGRKAAGEVAWAMFDDRPAFGFGPGGFELQVPRYSGLVPTAVTNPATTAPHDLYAQMACEGGVVGLIGWAILIIGVAVCIAIRVSQLAQQADVVERFLAAAALAAIVGWSVASIFIHLSYLRTFGILLALAGAMAGKIGPHWREPMREWPRVIAAAAAAAMVGLVVAAAILTASTTRTYTASQRVTLVPDADAEYNYAYALDMRTRTVVLPSYAALMVTGTSETLAVADTVRGIITITVTAPSHAAARESIDRAMDAARTNLADFGVDSLYSIEPIGGVVQRDEDTQSSLARAAAPAAGSAVGLGVFLLLRRRGHRRSLRGSSPEPVSLPMSVR
ncbi:O-antigen ligase family protein [Mycolicibacterium gilvum]|uniref:O-antigen ligase family protein n=1 Tax=Mycolicibacterium gilvum TaxID=1804 RepID=UPI0040465486